MSSSHQMDDTWMENVGPLIGMLEELGIDPAEWASDPDMTVFQGQASGESHEALGGRDFEEVMEAVHFACGYMQSTGNLIHLTWEEQIKVQLTLEEERNGG